MKKGGPAIHILDLKTHNKLKVKEWRKIYCANSNCKRANYVARPVS